MRKDQKYPRTRIDEDKMSTIFPCYVDFSLKSWGYYFCFVFWTKCLLTLSWILLHYILVNLWIFLFTSCLSVSLNYKQIQANQLHDTGYISINRIIYYIMDYIWLFLSVICCYRKSPNLSDWCQVSHPLCMVAIFVSVVFNAAWWEMAFFLPLPPAPRWEIFTNNTGW